MGRGSVLCSFAPSDSATRHSRDGLGKGSESLFAPHPMYMEY